MMTIWTDGACFPNPGQGAWAWIASDGRSDSGFNKNTTNNRMELQAAIEAIKAAGTTNLKIISDSQYLVKGITKWYSNWLEKGRQYKNDDLWDELGLLIRDKAIQFEWVKGHAEDEMNLLVDQLANETLLKHQVTIIPDDKDILAAWFNMQRGQK